MSEPIWLHETTPTDKLRALLDERRIEYETYDLPNEEHGVSWNDRNGIEWEAVQQGENFEIHALQLVTPQQAITATVGPTLDQDLQQALDFMRIWITDDAHLGESDISYELEKAEGLRNLEAIEQAIAATVGAEPDEATMLKLHDRMNAALLDYESAMGIEGGNGAKTVPFVIEMHKIIEDAAKVGVGTCHIETTESWLPAERYHRCKHCGAFFAVLDASSDIPPRVCPNCGRKVVTE